MTVVRIIIKKQLSDRKYAYVPADLEPFATEYLLQSDASFSGSDSQWQQYARGLAEVESHLFPAFIGFRSAKVQLATPGATAQELSGQFYTVDLDELCGKFAVDPDDVFDLSLIAWTPRANGLAPFGRGSFARTRQVSSSPELSAGVWDCRTVRCT